MATQLAADLPDLVARANQLDYQPIDVTEYQPTHFRFTDSSYRKYLPVDRTNLIGRVDVGTAVMEETVSPTWTQLHQRVSELEAEMTQQDLESRDAMATLEQELCQATKRETELTKQLLTIALKLKRTERLLIKPVRVVSIPGPKGGSLVSNVGVRGLAHLDNHLYVLQVGRSSTDIVVHDTAVSPKRLPTVVRRLAVPGLGDASDLAACGRHHCLYVADVGCDSIHRIHGLEGTLSCQLWPVGDKPWGLSVSSVCGKLLEVGSVWVSCFVRQKLKEFTGHGQPLRAISLHPDISYPWHAIPFGGNARLLVCHGGIGTDERRVIAVGMDGTGSTFYRLAKSSTPTAAGGPLCGGAQSNSPMHAAVDADNFIVVVDCESRVITVLDPDLVFVRDVVTASESANLGLKDPRRVCLDNDNSRMFVGDGNGSVTVLQLK